MGFDVDPLLHSVGMLSHIPDEEDVFFDCPEEVDTEVLDGQGRQDAVDHVGVEPLQGQQGQEDGEPFWEEDDEDEGVSCSDGVSCSVAAVSPSGKDNIETPTCASSRAIRAIPDQPSPKRWETKGVLSTSAASNFFDDIEESKDILEEVINSQREGAPSSSSSSVWTRFFIRQDSNMSLASL
ncbi:unnamed protein product, partial [Amoebophrya sp. A25]|eukprot:GSA25T00022012001.1